ncbi:hypothetical protein GCM10022393_29380 [Aquimarina addita]|uniref:Periplasmic copper-binding protein NosD beta helix domain-containing protein n=1 Tax=Aquimarina addita TaxID=870485 RepID=A0ABP6UQW4_9FLAO
MKKLIYPFLFCSLFFVSCSTDEGIDNEQNPESEPEPIIITATEPCVISDLDIGTNATITIDCLLDLEGNTIEVPSDVTFAFDGGDIFNGTLNFSSAGKIAGELLNSKLTITGDVSLLSEEFEFVPSRWDIVQTNSADPAPPLQTEAYSNHVVFQETINFIKKLGAKNFIIGKMDAYFDSDSNSVPVAYLPSNMNLTMADNTTLRVFPVDKDYTSMMFRVYDSENIIVSGGNLIGDRLEHGPTEGSKSLFWITASRNIIVENMHLSLASAGISVNSSSWYDYPDQIARPYIPSEDIIIRNCTLDSNQYNNLSVTDGYRVLIEGNTLYRAGNDVENKYYTSYGQAPRIGIVIEPASNGPGYTQRIEDVTIKSNIVEETRTNSILAVGAFRTIIDGNTVDGGIGWTTAAGVKVTNNTVLGGGIVGGVYFESYGIEKSTDNIIANNIIKNGATGIFLTNDETEVYDNEIIDCTVGIMMNKLVEAKIHNNIITNTTSEKSWGINSQFYVNDVEVYDNKITVNNGLPMYFISINNEVEEEDYHVNVYNNYFNGSSNISVTNSNNIDFSGNDFVNTGIGFGGASNIVFESNTIDCKTAIAVGINRAATSSQNIKILNNTIANTSGNRLEGYGVRINTVGTDYLTEDSNIEISGNSIVTLGQNYCFHSTNFDNLTISNNTLTSDEDYDYISLYFRGNNSSISDNDIIAGGVRVDIDGDNNTVINNE